MTKSKEPHNPFYWLCAVVGVIFTITACAYGVFMLRANQGLDWPATASGEHPLMSLLDRHGMIILGVEVAVLAAVSLAAIMLDHYRGQRAKSQRKP